VSSLTSSRKFAITWRIAFSIGCRYTDFSARANGLEEITVLSGSSFPESLSSNASNAPSLPSLLFDTTAFIK